MSSGMNKDAIIALVKGAQSGDFEAFDKLYNSYITPIYRYIYFLVKHKETAEDLTQTTFLKAWSGLADFKSESGFFSAWLYKIARNAVIDYWKKKKEISYGDFPEIFGGIGEENENVSELAEKKNFSRLVHEALDILSEEQKEAVILKFIEGLPNKEIAETLGKSEEAVRQSQCRALKTLRRHFKEMKII